MSTPDSLAQIFDSSLHEQRCKQARIEAFLSEIEALPISGKTQFYNAEYARTKYAPHTAARELIEHHQKDRDVQVCVMQAAKRIWDRGHRQNAFELCRLPEALMGPDLHLTFLDQSFRQIISYMPEIMVTHLAGIVSTKPVKALAPFTKYELTETRAEKAMAYFINRNARKNLSGVLSTVSSAQLQELPGLNLNLKENSIQLRWQGAPSVSVQIPQSKLNLSL